MSRATEPTDPRTIITPDAFSVAPELIGLPLAHPWRRATAILVDLLLVAILANAQAVFFAFAAGLFVFALATRRNRKGTPTTGRKVARVTFGCLGGFTLFVAALAIAAMLFGDPEDALVRLEDELPVSAPAMADMIRLSTATDSAEAAQAATRLAERTRSGNVDPDAVREFIDEVRAEEGTTVGLRALEAALAARDAESAEEGAGGDTVSVDGLLAGYAAARATGDSAEIARLGPRLGRELAAERIAADAAEIRRLESRSERLREELEVTEELLERERERGISATLVALLDDVGLGVGWAGLYFTFFLGWWKGRTPGKRLLGVRVVRLDARPLGYWVSFERYGGYAASLFTGLEGFARILWDPNRQALEDRLAGTVVILDSDEARDRLAHLPATA